MGNYTKEEDGEIRDGQREEVTVGGRVHGRVANDDGADGHIAHHALMKMMTAVLETND